MQPLDRGRRARFPGRGRPSVDLLRRTCGDALSEGEPRLHDLMREARITGWTANATLRVNGGTVVVDVLFAARRVVVEVDGWSSHSDRSSFERGRRRQNTLVNAGYAVLRFTWRDLVDRPAAVVTEIRTALEAG